MGDGGNFECIKKNMYIKELVIENFKCFNGQFRLELEPGTNILVGDNEVGKSTILEAINLALSGWLGGKYLRTELTQALFNNEVVEQYINSLQSDTPKEPPAVLVEVYLEMDEEEDSLKALFEGNYNTKHAKECGFKFHISFNTKYVGEYNLLRKEGLSSIPIEYYEYGWTTFARDDNITPKSIPIKAAVIDSSNTSYRTGSDAYMLRIIRDLLPDEQKVKISQAHRAMNDQFRTNSDIQNINNFISEHDISDKKISLSVDVSTKSAWETNLTTHVNDVPFDYVGKGEQSIIKTRIALKHKKANEANVLLVEEPENHLTHTNLNALMKVLGKQEQDKQILITTHSSFVANKLGLDNLILLNTENPESERQKMRLNELDEETKNYFQKLAGYDTLRLILCKKAILVEGDSDELVVQKAYHCKYGKLPIEDTIDVISVRSLAFKRFLAIAKYLKQTTVIVTDNDGKTKEEILKKYEDYNSETFIKVCFDEDVDSGDLEIKTGKKFNYNTLEPKMVKANGLATMNKVLGTEYTDIDALHKHMYEHKTECALKILEYKECADLEFPKYIMDAIS